MPGEELSVRPADVSVTDDVVTITSLDLVNALVRDRETVIEIMSEGAPVAVADISIDSQGRVVVSNRAYADRIKSHLAERMMDTNVAEICGTHVNFSCK